MQTRAIVTGASGFIGHSLCRFLQQNGRWVYGVDIKPPQWGRPYDGFELMDLRKSYELARLLSSLQFDEVYALAADMGGMGFISRHHLSILDYNARINLNTAIAVQQGSIKRLLFTSSACVYPEYLQMDTDILGLRETDAWKGKPDTAYGVEKLYAEEIYGRLAEKSDIEVRIARLHNIYGPEGSWNDGREKLPAAACRKVAEASWHRDSIDEPQAVYVNVWGDGEATRSFCYIDDCLNMLLLLMESDHSKPLNIGSGRAVSVDKVFDMVGAAAGIEVVKRHTPGPQGVRGRNADLTEMRRVLGYKHQISLEEGLGRTYEWVLRQVRRSE